MNRELKKIDLGTGNPKKRIVLKVPRAKRFVAMGDVSICKGGTEKSVNVLKRATNKGTAIQSSLSDEECMLIPEIDTVTSQHATTDRKLRGFEGLYLQIRSNPVKVEIGSSPRQSPCLLATSKVNGFSGQLPQNKPQSLRQPFITSFILKQKSRIELFPRAATLFKLTALTVICMLVTVPAVSAFEAHVVNVTAQLSEITPPTLTPPGSSTAWDDTDGGTGLSGNINVVMSDSYPEATDIYYTYLTDDQDPSLVPDPVCGQTGPNGGGGAIGLPQQLSIDADTVIKAIACDGSSATSHESYINTKIYTFGQPVNGLVINEFLPNPTGTPAGNQGVAGGNISGNGGEWVELFNNGTSTIDTDGFVLYDDFVPTLTPASYTWTTTSDFNSNPTPTANNTTVSSGSVVMLATQTSGTFEKVFDIGTNKQATWGSLSFATSQTDPLASICAAVATSDDDITYTPYTNLSPCANATSTSVSASLAALPNSRFLKWKATFTRSDVTTMVNLNSLTVNYNFVDYNTYHELVITTANTTNSTTPDSTIMPPGDFLVVYRDGNPNFDLDSQVNSVSLYDGHQYLGAALIDSHSYDVDSPIPVGHSIARIPDGSSNWVDPCPTPGAPNVADCSDPLPPDDSATTTATTTLDVLPLDNSTTTVDGSGNAASTEASSTPDSTTTPDDVNNTGSGGGEVIGDSNASSTPADVSASDASSTSTPNQSPSDGSGLGQAPATDATPSPGPTTSPDNSTTTVSSDATSDSSGTPPPPDNSTTTAPSVGSPDSSGNTTPATTPDTSSPSSGTTPPASPPPADGSGSSGTPDPGKQDAITPPPQTPDQTIAPPPAVSGGSGDGSPPPPSPAPDPASSN